jgi:hypothetical protein
MAASAAFGRSILSVAIILAADAAAQPFDRTSRCGFEP